jgi:hypothetical protein
MTLDRYSDALSKGARGGVLLPGVECRSRIAAHIFSKINYSSSVTERDGRAFPQSLPYNSSDYGTRSGGTP